jgi:hypothetical protein
MSEPEVLGISVKDEVKTKEVFGNIGKEIKGVAGTLHLTDESKKDSVLNTAIMLAKSTSLPVIIVIRL